MAFMRKGDYLILMNLDDTVQSMPGETIYSMDLDDIKKARDIGVSVVLEQTHWQNCERQKGTELDWRIIDNQVDRCLKAGMRVLLTAPATPARAGMPDEWFGRYTTGEEEPSYLSIWNRDAMAYVREYLEKVIARYSSSDVQVILHEVGGGELLLPLNACYYDMAALESWKLNHDGLPHPLAADQATKDWIKQGVLDHFAYMNEPVVKQHGEVWDSMHMVIAYHYSPCTGNDYQREVHDMYRRIWPECTIWLIQYTYVGHMGSTGYVKYLDDLSMCGVKVILEADHPRGLPFTTPLAIGKKFAGQICAPVHPSSRLPNQHILDWMLANMSDSLKLWRESGL